MRLAKCNYKVTLGYKNLRDGQNIPKHDPWEPYTYKILSPINSKVWRIKWNLFQLAYTKKQNTFTQMLGKKNHLNLKKKSDFDSPNHEDLSIRVAWLSVILYDNPFKTWGLVSCVEWTLNFHTHKYSKNRVKVGFSRGLQMNGTAQDFTRLKRDF